MAEASFDVEQIVREVMARLAGGASVSNVPAIATGSPGELRLDGRLVTLETLNGRLKGVQRVVVPPRAIVTPAVRDRLRELGIALDVASSSEASAKSSALTLIAWSDASIDLKALNNLLSADNIALKPCGCPDLPTAVGTISRAVTSSGRLGLIVTEATCAAICLANRKPGVQAVLGADTASVECAVRNLAANVLVVSPKAAPFVQKQLVAAFCRTERAMHEQYRKHL